jgi:diadenosine tetraphosphate (Ap4A) HIT family hydrolase
MAFALHPSLAADGPHLGDLALCRVVLRDDTRWPALILIPMRPDCREVFDLSETDQRFLIAEISLAARCIAKEPNVTKVNVGALGNIVSQLHVHIVGRWEGDPEWPHPVWGRGTMARYEPGALETVTRRLSTKLGLGLIQT